MSAVSGERGERRARLDVLARDEDDARLLRWTHCLELGVTQAKLLLQLLLDRARARARARASFSCSSGCKGTGQKARGHRTARSARSATSEAASSSTKDSGCAPKEPRAGQSRQGRPRRRRGRAWALPGVFRPCMYIYMPGHAQPCGSACVAASSAIGDVSTIASCPPYGPVQEQRRHAPASSAEGRYASSVAPGVRILRVSRAPCRVRSAG